jgi:ribosome production factor 2
MELVEVGPSMDLVVRRNRRAADSLQKEAMKAPGHAKKVISIEQLFFVHHILLS